MINDGDKMIKNRISDMEAAKGQVPFDKEAAWLRLHERLAKDKGPKGIKLPWRWAAAAAVLLLLLSVVALWNRPVGKHLTVSEKVQAPLEIPASPKVVPFSGGSPVLANAPQPVIHKKVVVKADKKRSRPIIIAPLPVVPPQHADADSEEAAKEVAIAPAPKMKVVHINELMADEEKERMQQWESKQYVSGSRSYFSFIKPGNTVSLFESDPAPQPLKIRFK